MAEYFDHHNTIMTEAKKGPVQSAGASSDNAKEVIQQKQ